jgi:hypothetical protein
MNQEDSSTTPADAGLEYLTDVLELVLTPTPRFAIATRRKWMEPYFRLEQDELGVRLATRRHSPYALRLWLKQLRLLTAGIHGSYDGEQLSDLQWHAVDYQLNLLGVSVSNSKLALDATLSGHYNASLAVVRNMLESWRRVAHVRKNLDAVDRWIAEERTEPPDSNAAERPAELERPGFKEICRDFVSAGTARDCGHLLQVGCGFKHLNNHSHPTLIGARQTRDPGNHIKHHYSPTFSRSHADRCLKWALFANYLLIDELYMLGVQNPDWVSEFNEAEEELVGLSNSFSDDEDPCPNLGVGHHQNNRVDFCQELDDSTKR